MVILFIVINSKAPTELCLLIWCFDKIISNISSVVALCFQELNYINLILFGLISNMSSVVGTVFKNEITSC